MIAGHRWERDYDWLGYRCVGLPFGGVESYQWCVGCNCLIGDLELKNSKLPIDDECFLHIALDMLAERTGYKPVEAGTYAEFCLQKKSHKPEEKEDDKT